MILCGDLPPARCRLGDSGEQRRQRNRTVSSALIIRVPTERPLHQGFQATSKSLVEKESWDPRGCGWTLVPAGTAAESCEGEACQVWLE